MNYPWHDKANRIFSGVIVVQWLVAVGLGVNFTSLSLALTLGTLAALPALILILKAPHSFISRHAVAISTQLLTALHIHLTMGLTEMHFEIFTVLAFLSIYRDWKIILTAVSVVAVHHISFFFMQLSGAPVFVFETGHLLFSMLLIHAFFAIAEGAVLMYVAHGMEQESKDNFTLSGAVQEVCNNGKIAANKNISGSSIAIIEFNNLLGALRELVGTIQTSGSSSAELSSQLQQTSEQTLVGLQGNAANVSQISSSLTQISSANSEVAENVEGINHLSGEVKNETTSTKALITENTQEAESLKNDIENAVSSIKSLADMVQNIESSMSSIKNISDQTNLLALNAAIESARAGEFGRGFSVVADEVRALALKTNNNAEEITQITELLSNQAKSAVNTMSTCAKQFEHSLQNTHVVNERVGNIDELMNDLNQRIATVASATEEQSSMSNTIAKSAQELQSSTENQVQAINSNQYQLNDLTAQINQLNSQLTRFET